MSKKVIIDLDTGIDDAQAVMIALTAPSVDVLAITCVSGNMDLDRVISNTLRVLKAWDRLDIPVYKGSAKSLLGTEMHVPGYHGKDGLGGYFDDAPPSVKHIRSEHAVHALTRLVNEHPGEITLVALAPLTNIALTHRLDPEFGNKLKEIVEIVEIMGGNISGMGNVTVSGEFNFVVDPESAWIVLNELACPKRIVSLETCMEGGMECERIAIVSTS